LKIALITRRYPPLIGGAERVLSYLAPALASQGVEVVVLTSQPTSSEPIPDSRVPVVRLPSPPYRVLGTWLYMRSLRRWLKRHPIDLAYVSMLKHDAYVALEAGRRHGFPVVLRPEGAGATGDLAWQSWGRFGRTIGERCKQADAIVAISQTIEDELVAAGYDHAKIYSLPNGVPVPSEPWTPRDGWRDTPRAVFVGRLAPEKGLDTLIEAWSLVRNAHPTARLTLIGKGPQRPALDAQIRSLGLGNAVTLPGSSADPIAPLRASDLFVLPSIEEGMSIALLEAMALGIPLVASSIPGNRKLVTEGEHGRLFVSGDPASLARSIQIQWAEFDRAVEMATNARKLVTRQFSIDAIARRHLDLFERLLRRKETV
jgi:glycosyltransferase involved in cell wall biosynthesis